MIERDCGTPDLLVQQAIAQNPGDIWVTSGSYAQHRLAELGYTILERKRLRVRMRPPDVQP
jgi:hypothetical protein